MPFPDYSTNPDANTSLGGINVGEGCPPQNVNGAIRRLAADGKLLADQVGGGAASMPISGGAFTGNVTRQGRGALLHHANAAQIDGQVYFLPEGTARPTAAEGVIVFYYS